MLSFHFFHILNHPPTGAALGFQIDGAKTFFSPQKRENSFEPYLLVEYSKKSMVQLHPLHHPNAAPV